MTAPRVLIGFNPNGTRGFTISPSRSKTHPNLKPILTFPKGRNKLLRILTSAPT